VRVAIIALVLLVCVVPVFAQSAEHGAEHEGAKFLGIPAWIWKFANMVAFLAVLIYFIGTPVKNALAARHEHVKHEAEEARDRRTKADQMAADIQTRLTQLEEEVRQIRERAQVEGERQKHELIAAAEAEAQKILNGARGEVDNRLKHARHELTEYAGQLASERAEQILREKTTDADRQKLFRESLKQVEEAQS
jgi:F-type H+-transporting ATPase subunit b